MCSFSKEGMELELCDSGREAGGGRRCVGQAATVALTGSGPDLGLVPESEPQQLRVPPQSCPLALYSSPG